MNFGDQLRKLRTEKNLTQPQLAEAIGIEQSYLSKLENDKSVPSAEIFQAILRALGIDVGTFLTGLDERVVHRDLKHIPEVAQHLQAHTALRIHNAKRWLFGSAVAAALGLTLLFAGFRHLVFPNTHYTYTSTGVVREGEPADIFLGFEGYLMMKQHSGALTEDEVKRKRVEMLDRVQEDHLTTGEYHGSSFIQPVSGGSRLYRLQSTVQAETPHNRYLMLFGTLLAAAGACGFLVEARMRSLKPT